MGNKRRIPTYRIKVYEKLHKYKLKILFCNIILFIDKGIIYPYLYLVVEIAYVFRSRYWLDICYILLVTSQQTSKV